MKRRKKKCPSCLKTKFWKLKDGRLKCRSCRKTFRPKNNPVGLKEKLLRSVVSEFVLAHSTNVILERVKIAKYKLLKTLRAFRLAMTRDVPPVFEGIVEVDETYVGGQWKNKRLETRRISAKSKRGRGATKQPVFGILCRNGQVFAELIDNVEAEDLQPIIEQKVKRGSVVCSDAWRAPASPPEVTFIEWRNMAETNTPTSEEITSTGWKDSGVTSKENCRPRAAFGEKCYTCT